MPVVRVILMACLAVLLIAFSRAEAAVDFS